MEAHGAASRARHACFARARGRPGGPPRDSVEGGIFTYYLHTSPFRVYHEDAFTLRGWAWPQDGRPVTSVRAVVDGRSFIGRYGLEEPEVIARHGAQPANPRPGFEVRFETPPGRHLLSLEAQLEGAEWRWIMRTSIWCEPEAAMTAPDANARWSESTSTLGDRSAYKKVWDLPGAGPGRRLPRGGWAHGRGHARAYCARLHRHPA